MDQATLTGVVCGSVFGGIFLMTCVLSAVKAIRDRKRIKKQNEEKRLKKQERNGILHQEEHLEESGIFPSETSGDSPRRNGIKANGVVGFKEKIRAEERLAHENNVNLSLPTTNVVSLDELTIDEAPRHTVVTIENKTNGSVVKDSRTEGLVMNYRGGTPNGITNPAFTDDQPKPVISTKL